MAKRGAKLTAVILVSLVVACALASSALASSWSDVPDSLLESYGVSGSQVAAIADGYADGSF